MRRHIWVACLALGAAAPAGPLGAQALANGTDTFAAGPEAAPPGEVAGDLFATGPSVTLRDRAGGDAHLAGLDLAVAAPVGGDLYAMGGSVALRAAVASDATLAGWSVRLEDGGSVAGNARLAGGTVRVEGPVGGALTVAGADVTLDGAVEGDVWVTADRLAFGPDARIAGRLVYAAPEAVEVPPEVVPPERVTFEPSEAARAAREAREDWRVRRWMHGPGALGLLWGGVVGFAFLLATGGLFLALAPRLVEETAAVARGRAGRSLLLGLAGLSLLAGLVPVLAVTLVGLPLVPVALLLVVAGWLLGYLLGVYVTVRGVLGRLGAPGAGDATALRVVSLAGGLLVAGLLNFVPFLGWMANLVLVFLGLGAMTSRLIDRLARRDHAAAPAGPVVPPAPPPAPPP